MSRDKVLLAIARHDQLIHRAKRMIAADKAGRPLPDDAQYHMQELQDFEAAMVDLIIEVTAESPKERDWIAPGSFAVRHEPRGDNWEKLGWLKTYLRGLEISKGYFQRLLSLYAEELHMGDKITVRQAQVVVGSHSRTGDITTHGYVAGGSIEEIDLSRLADELSLLRQALRAEANLPEHDIALGAVAAAERCSREGDARGAMANLKSAGKWCLDIASKIGVSVASEAIKSSLGIGKGAA